MRKHLWIGILFAGICLYFAFRGISFHQLFSVLAHGKPHLIFLSLGIYGIGYYLRSERWAILIKPVKAISAKDLFWPMIIGFFANNVLPFRIGEFVRAHVCGTKFKISRTASLGSILLERICDTLSFLTTFLVASFFYPFPRYMESGAWLLGGACLFVIAVLILIRKHEDTFHAILDRTPLKLSWKNQIKHLATHFIHSTSGMTQPRYIVESMALSLVIWVIEGSFLFFMAHAFSVDLKYAGAFFLLFALGLSVTLPQAPGSVGTYELFGVTAFALLGIPKEQGLPVILAMHGTQFIFIGILGLLGLWREGLTFDSLTAAKNKE